MLFFYSFRYTCNRCFYEIRRFKKKIARKFDYFSSEDKRVMNLFDYYTGELNKNERMNLVIEEGATAKDRNEEVGGHKG